MDSIKLTPENLIGSGIFSLVYRISDARVRKVPRNEEADNVQAVRTEAHIYALLEDSGYTAKCLSINNSADYVDLEYAINGTLEEYVQKSKMTEASRIQMGRIIIECVKVLHSYHVIHSDLGLRQFLLFEECLPKISDFGASGCPGRAPLGMENASHYMPRHPDEPNSVQSDLFALGSTLYELMAGESPYHGKPDHEIEFLYQQEIFPCTKDILCGEIISGCWTKQFKSADEALHAYDSFVARQYPRSDSN